MCCSKENRLAGAAQGGGYLREGDASVEFKQR